MTQIESDCETCHTGIWQPILQVSVEIIMRKCTGDEIDKERGRERDSDRGRERQRVKEGER